MSESPPSSSRRDRRTSAARWISILGHPFTFVLIMVLTSAWAGADPAAALRSSAIVLGFVVLPLGWFLWWRRASGRWSTVDASEPRERPALYTAALVLLVPLALYYVLAEEPGTLLRGTVAVGVLLAVGAVANRWIKLSLHTAFALFAGVVLARTVPPLGFGILTFAPVLAWSRLEMGRHSPMEVAAGAALGTAVGVLTLGL